MKIASVSLNQTPLDWNRNADNIRCAIDWAKKQDTMLLCLPELCISSAGCGQHFKRPGVIGKSMDILKQLLPEMKGMIVAVGLPLEFEGSVFNTVCMVLDGKPLGFQCKTGFAGGPIDELRWFRPWPRGQYVPFELDGEAYKLGDMSFEFRINESTALHVAIDVGEPDWRATAVEPTREGRKIDLLFNPMSSAFSFEKHAKRLEYARKSTAWHHYVHVCSNYIGNEAGPMIFDGGSFIAQEGCILAESPRFSFHDVQACLGNVDLALIRSSDHGVEAAKEKTETKTEHDAEEKSDNKSASSPDLPNLVDIKSDEYSREEEFSRAVSLGLLDYLRKSGAKGFALSLSGGADSGAVAVLVALGIQTAWSELGREGFLSEFDFIPDISKVQSPEEAVGCFLTCFYQATRNSGETTRKAAKTLADNIGAKFYEFDLDPIVEQYLSMLSKTLGRDFDWKKDDIALQNIQARARVPSAWFVANLQNTLLLATGNRSEAAVGYTTMDGDTAGCLAPIGGVDKEFLLHWLSRLETHGFKIGDKTVTMPFLSVITTQKPTAELRPPQLGQTDEDDLMPYSVLNRIEQLGPMQGKSRNEMIETLKKEFPDESDETVRRWVERFHRLWRNNIWKRNRYALSFHLDDDHLPAADWRRFPTLSGDFEF